MSITAPTYIDLLLRDLGVQLDENERLEHDLTAARQRIEDLEAEIKHLARRARQPPRPARRALRELAPREIDRHARLPDIRLEGGFRYSFGRADLYFGDRPASLTLAERMFVLALVLAPTEFVTRRRVKTFCYGASSDASGYNSIRRLSQLARHRVLRNLDREPPWRTVFALGWVLERAESRSAIETAAS